MTTSARRIPLEDSATLDSLAVDNLRALRMDTPVELRRLMLLVGRNGIGKSTLARVFPLLRQSVVGRKREPLLWWERGEVDFGSFEEALRRGTNAMTLAFGFKADDGTPWTCRSTLIRGDHGSRVERVTVEQGDRSLSMLLDPAGRVDTIEGRVGDESFVESRENREGWLFGVLDTEPGRLFAITEWIGLSGHAALVSDLFAERADLGIPPRALLSLYPWTTEQETASMISEDTSDYPEARRKWRELLLDSTRVRDLRRTNFVGWALYRMLLAETCVLDVAQRTAYLGPFRAAPERTYRSQGVAVEQLDPRGSNLAMFLAALSEEERADLDSYLHTSLDFGIHTERLGGQHSLHVELNEARYNLVDAGSGYSHMLPVAVQLWASTRTLSTDREQLAHAIVVVEQPELHLHPHQQVLMARVLGAFAAADHGPIQLIETHSDHLVGEVGMLIARGQLSPDRVSVLCFEAHPEDGTTVRVATFDDEGVLQNWPVGFLAP